MEGTAGSTIERLSSELASLKVLGCLSEEEAQALGEHIECLRRMNAGMNAEDAPESDLSEFIEAVQVLAADLDLAFRRLTVPEQGPDSGRDHQSS